MPAVWQQFWRLPFRQGLPGPAVPEFARSAEEWAKLRDNVMEYDELAGLIHEYNVTVQNNQRDFNEKKNKTSDEIAQDYRDAADAIRSSMSGEG